MMQPEVGKNRDIQQQQYREQVAQSLASFNEMVGAFEDGSQEVIRVCTKALYLYRITSGLECEEIATCVRELANREALPQSLTSDSTPQEILDYKKPLLNLLKFQERAHLSVSVAFKALAETKPHLADRVLDIAADCENTATRFSEIADSVSNALDRIHSLKSELAIFEQILIDQDHFEAEFQAEINRHLELAELMAPSFSEIPYEILNRISDLPDGVRVGGKPFLRALDDIRTPDVTGRSFGQALDRIKSHATLTPISSRQFAEHLLSALYERVPDVTDPIQRIEQYGRRSEDNYRERRILVALHLRLPDEFLMGMAQTFAAGIAPDFEARLVSHYSQLCLLGNKLNRTLGLPHQKEFGIVNPGFSGAQIEPDGAIGIRVSLRENSIRGISFKSPLGLFSVWKAKSPGLINNTQITIDAVDAALTKIGVSATECVEGRRHPLDDKTDTYRVVQSIAPGTTLPSPKELDSKREIPFLVAQSIYELLVVPKIDLKAGLGWRRFFAP